MKKVNFVGVDPDELTKELAKCVEEKMKYFLEVYKPTTPNDYLTRKQVAQLFNVDLSTVHNWCKKGKLRPLGIGARVYFLRSDVDNCLIPLNNPKDEQ